MGKVSKGRSATKLNHQYGDSDCFPTCLLNAFLCVLDHDESIPPDVIKRVWKNSMDGKAGNKETAVTSLEKVKAVPKVVGNFAPLTDGSSDAGVTVKTEVRTDSAALADLAGKNLKCAAILRVVLPDGDDSLGHYVLVPQLPSVLRNDDILSIHDPLVGVDRKHEALWRRVGCSFLESSDRNVSVSVGKLEELRKRKAIGDAGTFPVAVVVSREPSRIAAGPPALDWPKLYERLETAVGGLNETGDVSIKLTQNGRYDVSSQSQTGEQIPGAPTNGIYVYLGDDGEVWLIGKGQYKNGGGIGYRSCAHLGAYKGIDGGPAYPFHQWRTDDTVDDRIVDSITAGTFTIVTVTVEPDYCTSLVEVLAQTLYAGESDESPPGLPPLNRRIG